MLLPAQDLSALSPWLQNELEEHRIKITCFETALGSCERKLLHLFLTNQSTAFYDSRLCHPSGSAKGCQQSFSVKVSSGAWKKWMQTYHPPSKPQGIRADVTQRKAAYCQNCQQSRKQDSRKAPSGKQLNQRCKTSGYWIYQTESKMTELLFLKYFL